MRVAIFESRHALEFDGFVERVLLVQQIAARQRVAPPRLRIAPHQRVRARIEEQ